jgi:anti-sigma-K factor RskA
VDVHELTAAYALDALDSEERDAYEAHLARCPRCRDELAGLGETAAALGFGVESPAPPPALRDRILAAAARERENVASLPVRRPWPLRIAAAAAAIAACAAVGLGVWAGTLRRSLDAERSARAAEARAMDIYTDPASTRTALRGATGTLAVDPHGRGVLVVKRLPGTPADKTYEAWVIAPGGKPARAGLFQGGGSTTLVALDRAVPQGAVVAATVERAGGVEAPSTAPILTAHT